MKIYTVYFKYDWGMDVSPFVFTSMERAAAYGEHWFRVYPPCLSYLIDIALMNPEHSEPKNFAL